MISRISSLTAIALLSLSVSACNTTSSVQTSVASAPIAPVEVRRAVVGDTFVYISQTGKERVTTIETVGETIVTGNTIQAGADLACTWKYKRNTFAPDAEWNNCGNSGTQTSKRLGGSIFPITVGSNESWEYSGTNNKGASWSSTRNCEAVGTVSITVPAGTFDTYHVKCEDRVWLREWFIRADGVTVQANRTRKTGAQDRNTSRKLVSFKPA